MSYKRLGDYLQLVDNRNTDMAVTEVCGVSMEKYFIPSIANTNSVDLSKYKIVNRGQFGLILMKVGRDNKVSVAYLDDKDAVIISPAYHVFEIIDPSKLAPEFLMMWLLRPENDRLLGFMSASSVRGSITFEEFGDIEIPIPDITEQRKYVALYKAILANQKTYLNSLEDLQLICDTYIEDLIKKEEPKVLGDYIQQSDERNSELEISFLQGVSTSKVLINSKANTSGVSFHNYKIVRNGQFVYVADTSRRGEKIALAMNSSEDCIVSSIYTVFEVKDSKELLPEYLYLFFQRTEFDRYARFHSWGSARETFDWADMCDVKLPVPSMEKQEAIVTIYHTLETRKRINEQLKESIKPLCPVLMKGVVEGMEIQTVNAI